MNNYGYKLTASANPRALIREREFAEADERYRPDPGRPPSRPSQWVADAP